MVEGRERGYHLSLPSWAGGWVPGVGRLLQDGAHLDSSGLSGVSRASQPSRVPSGCCVHRRAATKLHGMASGNNDFLFSPSVSLFPFPSSWLMVAQAGPDQWREVALFLSDLSPRWPAAGPFVHPAVSVSPDSQLSSLDTTFPRDTDLSGFTHSHSRLARAHAEQGRRGGDTRFFPPSFSLSFREPGLLGSRSDPGR